ncbi:hypothetical protein SNE40_019763 [Patella caerulea]|uniref:Hexosyltransferase n=1 Tax=Patella caerulea TaxID=87958 RepID=A0AAN8P6I5_PATCE
MLRMSANTNFTFEIRENTNFFDESQYYSLKSNKINGINHEFLIQPRNFCEELPYLIILVPSVHTNKIHRHTIRRTWGGENWPGVNLEKTVKLVFLFGKYKLPEMEFIIKQEAEIFNDIVQGNYIDSYFNLTTKILNGLQWVSENCDGTKYVLKADEDTFTNVPLLIEFLKQHGVARSVIGHLYSESHVKRVGKWAVPKSLFPLHTYPDYMAGNTYVLSGDILGKIVRTAQYVPYLNIEDVFITGVLVRILKLRHVNVVGFTMWTSAKPRICDILKKKIITGNKVTPKYAETIWQALHNNSYDYDC